MVFAALAAGVARASCLLLYELPIENAGHFLKADSPALMAYTWASIIA